jgi:uncharacterized protein YhfF
MNKLNPVEARFWEEFLNSIDSSALPANPYVEASYAGNPAISDELIDLYISGKKTAGSSLVEDYQTAGDPLPKVGDYWIALGGGGNPRIILKIVSTETHKFKDVPERIARAEGEGDRSLEYWRRVHTQAYSPYLASWGVHDLSESHVITQFFELVYP